MGHSNISVTAKIHTHMMDEVFEQSRKRLVEYANSKNTMYKSVKMGNRKKSPLDAE